MKDRIDALLDEMGITPGPWAVSKDGWEIKKNTARIAGMLECLSTNPEFCIDGKNREANVRIMSQSREMLKALIMYLLAADRLPPLTAIEGALTAEYKIAVTAINSATPHGWDWDRIKSYLENCG